MKLNYRDKVLLMVVFVALILVLGIVVFIKPALSKASDASKKLDAQKVTLNALNDQIKADSNLSSIIQDLYTKTMKVANNFYDYQSTYFATATVLKGLKNSNITNDGMTISAYSSSTLKPFTYVSTDLVTDNDSKVDQYNSGITSSVAASTTDSTAAAANTTSTDATAVGETTVGSYIITFNFESSLSDFKKYCESLTTNTQKSMLIESCTIDDVSASKIKGSISLNMMVMKKLSNPLK